jgi:hypothetical protein
MKRASRVFLLLSIAVLMAGCRLAVIVVEGGEVQSTSSGTCVAGMICIVDVDDPGFSETFTAVPDTGWYFRKWNSGDRFLCGRSTNPICKLSFKGYEESNEVQEMVASSHVFYLMPVFTLPQPISGTIIVNGREWAQPDLFIGLSWDEIKAVCSAQTGACSGLLNGYKMTGWTWASLDDVTALFNFYLGSEVLGVHKVEFVREFDSLWLPKFFDDGWHSVVSDRKLVWGVTRTARTDESEAFAPYIGEQRQYPPSDEPDAPFEQHVAIWQDVNHDEKYQFGAWFYRSALNK